MQLLLELGLLFLLQLFVMQCWTAGTSSQPYCPKNLTEISYNLVTKTRLKTVSPKSILKKITFRKDTQIEMYEALEPVYKIRVQRACCEGYKMSELDLCEPECDCPQHSKCVEPEVCECLKGYFSARLSQNGKHYCAPICENSCPENSACVAPNECACERGYQLNENKHCRPYCVSGCPFEGRCVAPNTCACQEGYQSAKGSCVPICTLGDQCQNGVCVAKDQCKCNQAYLWNNKTFKCEFNARESNTFATDLDEIEGSTNSADIMAVETDIETSNDDIDPNQVFEEYTATTTFYVTTDEYEVSTSSSLTGENICPHDYVYHKGICRPLKFVSDEIDCWLRPCQDEHAVCLESGTCACVLDFKMFKSQTTNPNTLNKTTTIECLSPAEYETRVANLKDPKRQAAKKPINWTFIFFMILGVIIMLTALVYLAIKLFLKQTGELDVEGECSRNCFN